MPSLTSWTSEPGHILSQCSWLLIKTRLTLYHCTYTWPQYVHRGENHLSQNRSINVRHDLPHPACTVHLYVIQAVQSYDKNTTEAMTATHENILLCLAMTMGSTSCKPSQGVSKRSREQIQPITISTPETNKKNLRILGLGLPSLKAKWLTLVHSYPDLANLLVHQTSHIQAETYSVSDSQETSKNKMSPALDSPSYAFYCTTGHHVPFSNTMTCTPFSRVKASKPIALNCESNPALLQCHLYDYLVLWASQECAQDHQQTH